jgi:hypothetical protein
MWLDINSKLCSIGVRSFYCVRNGGILYIRQFSFWLLKVMIMEAESICETSVNLWQTTRRSIPEDSYLHPRRREDLKSHRKEPLL